MDDQVAVPTDGKLRRLLDRFVCVRMVQMWGVDLRRFQFDFAMTWAVFFTSADGTIYGRYGTRSGTREHSSSDISLDGFKRSMEAALRLHERFASEPDAVRAEVIGKQTRHAPRWPRPEEIPALKRNERLARPFRALSENRNERAHGVGCIHCHMVPSHELRSLHDAGLRVDDRLIWPWPQTQNVGMRMDPEQRATVQSVREGSIAAEAGVRAGDEVLRFDGQTIVSPADMQWVLHNAASGSSLAMAVRRNGEVLDLILELGVDWRERLGNWRFTNLGICMQIAGFQGRPDRSGAETLSIRVGRVHRKRLSGIDLRQNDVIVAIDGIREPMNLGQLTRYLLHKKPGSEIAVTRRRRGESEEKTLRWKLD